MKKVMSTTSRTNLEIYKMDRDGVAGTSFQGGGRAFFLAIFLVVKIGGELSLRGLLPLIYVGDVVGVLVVHLKGIGLRSRRWP